MRYAADTRAQTALRDFERRGSTQDDGTVSHYSRTEKDEKKPVRKVLYHKAIEEAR